MKKITNKDALIISGIYKAISFATIWSFEEWNKVRRNAALAEEIEKKSQEYVEKYKTFSEAAGTEKERESGLKKIENEWREFQDMEFGGEFEKINVPKTFVNDRYFSYQNTQYDAFLIVEALSRYGLIELV